MTPQKYIIWLKLRMVATEAAMKKVDKKTDLPKLTMLGGKLKGYKDALDFYNKHFITHVFH